MNAVCLLSASQWVFEFIEYAEKAETSFIVLSDIPGLIFSEVLTDNPSLLFREFVDERTVISCLEDW